MKALWSYGFRPFFLLASLFAAVSAVVWLLTLRGVLAASPSLPLFSWHAHEMLFGFTAAVLAGFLLTAVRNWTGGQPTLEGRGLMVLVAVWLSARVLALWPVAVPPLLHILVDAMFFVALAVAIAIPLVKTKNRRNLALPPLLLVFGAADVAMHLGALGFGDALLPLATVVALQVPMVFLVVIGGRVLPFFTRGALRGENVELKDSPVVAYAGIAAVISATIAEAIVVVAPSVVLVAVLANAATGVLLLVRMRGWGTLHTFKKPVLAVLHVGWALLGVGFLLLAFARGWPSLLAPTTALHALSIGGLSVIILGMMSRVGLGHTGRPIVVTRTIAAAYVLLVVAALVRVAVPALAPSTKVPFLDIAATLFAAAFALFFVVYLPILVSRRADEPASRPRQGSLSISASASAE